MLDLKRKKIITAVSVLLLTGLYLIIFCFSAENGDESSHISERVTKALLQFYYAVTGSGGKTSEMAAAATSADIYAAEGMVRKMAHFMEYMGVGILSYTIVLLWMGAGWRGRLLIFGQLVISAGLDEWHQSFIPGRYASLKDVAIDTSGGVAGILLLLVLKSIWDKRRKTQQ